MITPFDLFGEGKYCYTFRAFCEEDKNIALGDGAVRIFLNTRGRNEGEVSRELVDFLHYIERTDEQSAMESGSENIRKIHECVKRIKSNEEIGVKYMQTWEEKVIERQRGEEEGKEEATKNIVTNMLKKGMSDAEIIELVECSQTLLDELKKDPKE